MEGEEGVTPQMYNTALNQIDQLHTDLDSHRDYQFRLEGEFDASKEEARKGREERQVLRNTINVLKGTIGNLSHENRRLKYEKEQRDMAENEKMEEEEVRRIDAETKLIAARMQATNYRDRYDELFDKLAEMEKKEKESIASINEARSTIDQKLDEANKKAIGAQTQLTTSQMKCVVLESEKEELQARVNELSRSGTQCLVEKRDSVDIEKLMKEKEELAKDKQTLTRRLLNERTEMSDKHRKQMAEIEEIKKKDKAEWDELRSKLSGDMKEAHERIYELETSDSYHELKRLEEEMEELKDDFDKILDTKKELVHKLDASRKKVNDLERDWRDSDRRKEAECNVLQERFKNKEKEFSIVQTRNDELEKLLDSTTNKFKELQSAKKLADEEIEKMREANGRLENEKSTAVRELTDVRLRVEERIEEMNSQIAGLNKEKTELFGSVVKSESDSAMYRDRYDQLEKKVKEEMSAKESESTANLTRYEELERELGSTREALMELQREKNLVDDEILMMRETLENLKNAKQFDFDVLQTAFAMLSEHYEIVVDQNTKLEDDLEDARSRVQEIMRSKRRSIEKNQSLESENGVLSSRILSLNSQIVELTRENSE